jgi:imidazolonepropionase-like amidohydrolase
MYRTAILACLFLWAGPAGADEPAERFVLLKPARVYDGIADRPHDGWAVLVRGNRIEAVGPSGEVKAPKDCRVIDLPGTTLLPGLIDAHTHLLLHPYNEAPWDKQVLNEALALRVCRATNHAKSTLLAGFTTIRDLGTEGAGYADVGVKQAIQEGIVPGPRMLVTTRAIIATGTYAPRGFAPEVTVPQGAEEADGEALRRVVRDQISKGADWIKVYADYPWGPEKETRPTFSLEELKLIVETAKAAGVPVVAHATSKEGMRRATLAGVETIEHGYDGDAEVYRLMVKHGVALCPTLAADEAMSKYRGWKKRADPKQESPKSRATATRASSPTATTHGSWS